MPDPAKVFPPLPAQDAVEGDFNPYTGSSNQYAQAAAAAAARSGFPGTLTAKPAGSASIVGYAFTQVGPTALPAMAASEGADARHRYHCDESRAAGGLQKARKAISAHP